MNRTRLREFKACRAPVVEYLGMLLTMQPSADRMDPLFLREWESAYRTRMLFGITPRSKFDQQ